jgi:threonine/homoserine/homoserine lactone efflux protein
MLIIDGLVAGFAYAFMAFAGAILCVRYVLQKGWLSGAVFGLGVATVQALWAAIASLAFVGPSFGINPNNKMFGVVGTIVLFFMAYKMYRSPSEEISDPEASSANRHALKAYLSGVGISAPFAIRILGYLGIFTALGIHLAHPSISDAVPLAIGVMFGSFIWWLGFVLLTLQFRNKVTPDRLKILNKVSAIIFTVLGIISLISLL